MLCLANHNKSFLYPPFILCDWGHYLEWRGEFWRQMLISRPLLGAPLTTIYPCVASK